MLRFRALLCFMRAPAASDRPLDASGVDFGSHFGSKNVVFSSSFHMRFLSCCLSVFPLPFLLYFCVCWPCAQKAERSNSTHPPSENVFFQGARLRRLCRKDDNRWSKMTSKIEWRKDKQSSKKHAMSGSRRRPPKKAPKMTSRRLPGTLREPPGRARRGPRGAKRAPRRPQEPPPKSRSEAVLEAKRSRRAFWDDVGLMLGRCWPHCGLLFCFAFGLSGASFLDLSILHPAETLFTPFSLQASKN